MSDGRRVLIVDALHLAYKAAYGRMPQLTATVQLDGQLQQINTVIPTFISKTIHRWSLGGVYPTIVCFDGRNCNISRKAYFKSLSAKKAIDSAEAGAQPDQVAYKGSRGSQTDKFYQSVNLTYSLLYTGGVGVLRAEKYEADDLVKAAVDLAKIQYPGMPIDVVTGDADLVPLVDDQVSVFLSSRKRTYATDESIKKNHYCQITPENYSTVLEDLTSYKSIPVPYNTLLLVKLLRGDKSDGIGGYPKFTPTKYKKLIEEMQNDGVDFADTFRYGCPVEIYCDRLTGDVIPPEKLATTPADTLCVKYQDPVELTNMLKILEKYLDESIIQHVAEIYRGINLNGVFFDGVDQRFWRKPARLKIDVSSYNYAKLQQVLQPLRIHLPVI